MTRILVAASLLVLSSITYAQEPHIHGQNVPDWYDPSCCNQRDCKPVLDRDVEITVDGAGTAIIRYTPTGNVFYQSQWRRSQDERYHACISRSLGSLCFYIRTGV